MQLAEQDREKEDISVARDDFEARELFFFFCFDDCHTRAMFGPSHTERERHSAVSHTGRCVLIRSLQAQNYVLKQENRRLKDVVVQVLRSAPCGKSLTILDRNGPDRLGFCLFSPTSTKWP